MLDLRIRDRRGTQNPTTKPASAAPVELLSEAYSVELLCRTIRSVELSKWLPQT